MKRTLDSFLISSQPKKLKIDDVEFESTSQPASDDISSGAASNHPTYPFPIRPLPHSLHEGFGFAPASEPRTINDKPDLDLKYYAPYIPSHIQKELFEFLRRELFFYRVQYKIKRGPTETQITTPRYTTVFGIDETSTFTSDSPTILEATTRQPIPKGKYKCSPRPLPQCLEALRAVTEATTAETFNICLVNYYASGADSISYHSDDERFLGADPAIASLSLGARRDFLMKHKPLSPAADGKKPADGAAGEDQIADAEMRKAIEDAASKPLKLALSSGDMVLMRGATQSRWLHSIPKRRGPGSEGGRINITFRKALVKAGTENYYRYNVGDGGVFRWDEKKREMVPWAGGKGAAQS